MSSALGQEASALPGDRPTTSSQVPPNRRRDKPQLSCNLCRRRKLKCDRGIPCSGCSKRGIPLSCVYAHNASPSHTIQRTSASAVPSTPAAIQTRIGHLEKLVVELMGNADKSKSKGPPRSVTTNTALMNALTPPSDFDDVEPPEPSAQISAGVGSMSLESSSTSYVENDHWSAILDGIAELKEYFDENKVSATARATTTDVHEMPAVIFAGYKHASKQEILSSLPTKSEADRMIGDFFMSMEYAPVILHPPTFLKEYAQMWADPSAVSLMWLSMFFSILCLSLRLQTLILSAELSEYDVVEARQRMQIYQERATQSLVLGRFTLCAPGTVEALLFYNYMEYFAAADPSIGGWSFFAMTVRLAMRAGYHRDASSYPEIKPFEAEMRRRVWSLMRQMDIMSSAQIGLPKMITETMSDTQEPANLLDSDLFPGMTHIPATRPDTVVTRVLVMKAKSRLISMQGMITDVTNSAYPSSYTEVMSIDKLLNDTYNSFPPDFRPKSMAESILDEPGLVMRRCLLELVYHKLVVNLHRKYLIVGRTDEQYIYSRRACLEAALASLKMQEQLDGETQPAGRFSKDRWKLTSPLIQGELLLATTILCLDVTHDLKLESLPSQKSSLNQSNQESPISHPLTASPPGLDLPTRARSLAALTVCSRIWASIADTSEAAAKACAAVRFVLARAVPQASQPPQQHAQAPQQQYQQQAGMPMAFDSTVYSTNANLTGVTGSGLADMQLDGFDMDNYFFDQSLDDILGLQFDIDMLADVHMEPIHSFRV